MDEFDKNFYENLLIHICFILFCFVFFFIFIRSIVSFASYFIELPKKEEKEKEKKAIKWRFSDEGIDSLHLEYV